MVAKQSALKQSEAKRLLKAARSAGYSRARLITHPDGRIEVIGEDAPAVVADTSLSPFDHWKANNAR